MTQGDEKNRDQHFGMVPRCAFCTHWVGTVWHHAWKSVEESKVTGCALRPKVAIFPWTPRACADFLPTAPCSRPSPKAAPWRKPNESVKEAVQRKLHEIDQKKKKRNE